jgi:internalin A
VKDQVFISYSHKDDTWRVDLETHLKPYLRNSSITTWSDRQVRPGSKWEAEITAALTNTRIAVLLVSSDFSSSDFIHNSPVRIVSLP